MAYLEINATEKVEADSAEDIVAATDMELETAMVVFDIASTRSQRRGEWDALVMITDWLAEQRGGHKYLLVESLEEVSQKAYLAKGVRDVNVTGIRHNDAETITAVLTLVDESEGEYVDEKGVTFVPKSQCDQIVELTE